MAEDTRPTGSLYPQEPEEPLPLFQRLLDNVWLLLVVGVVIPLGSYLVWGLVELLVLPAGS